MWMEIERLNKALTAAMDAKCKAVRQKELLVSNIDEIEKSKDDLKILLKQKEKKIEDLVLFNRQLKRQKNEISNAKDVYEIRNSLIDTNLKAKNKRIKDLEEEITEHKSNQVINLKRIKDLELNVHELCKKMKSMETTDTESGVKVNDLLGQISQLKKKQKVFKEDFLACMDHISDKRTLQDKLMALKRRHVDNEEGIVVDKKSSTEYERKIKFLSKSSAYMAKVAEEKERKRREDNTKNQRRYEKLLQDHNSVMDQLIEAKREVTRIRTERETQKVVTLAPKDQGVMGWLMSKCNKIATALAPVHI
ncbi:hypothetical protein GBF38_004007 [Nibea albiflora]|uniref:Uncharacterized protein n=1 Tax=Nibea albiflora TaxID=240163 RepID=A0ACB7FCS5_NIBAL|nr:hypothetical protein GBF38_004007 [Nibea albiflora]